MSRPIQSSTRVRRAAACALTVAILGLAGAGRADQQPAVSPVVQGFSIILVGDTGFPGDSDAPSGIIHRGKHYEYDSLLADIADELDADFMFANIETVVSAKDYLRPVPSSFNFRSHPDSVDALLGYGFNMFSLANNHALDFGLAGAVETRTTFAAAAASHPMAFSGVGDTRDRLLRPSTVERDGTTAALMAIGFLTLGGERFRASAQIPGQLSLKSRDFDDAVKALSATPADIKLLSVHYGEELANAVSRQDIRRLRPLLRSIPGTHVVVGHHPHVARAIEVDHDNVIFYGLGNFLHLGTNDMSDLGQCRDFSLLAKLHYRKIPGGAVTLRAIEVAPIQSTHIRPRRMPRSQAALRIAALNAMSDRLDRSDGTHYGVTLMTLADGSGLYCRPGAAATSDRIGRLCGAFNEASARPEHHLEVPAPPCATDRNQ